MSNTAVQERRPSAEEVELLAKLRAGDERAFETLVNRHYGTMLAVAQTYVSSRAVAEEVVQEAWLGVLKGLDGFEGRSSLSTWIMRILANIAMTRGGREARSIPYASLAAEGDEHPVEPDRFRGAADGFPGHWRAYPADWARLPEDALVQQETLRVAVDAIAGLPPVTSTFLPRRPGIASATGMGMGWAIGSSWSGDVPTQCARPVRALHGWTSAPRAGRFGPA